MNNCKVTLVEGISKKGKYYAYLDFEINGKKLVPIFIKETEVLYYKDLIK